MFAFLRGVVTRKTVRHLELDVNGVGYEVFAPDRVYSQIAIEQTVTLLTYCHIREDAFLIFGFLREEEKALFVMLLSISGVGPKVALAILSAISPRDFTEAVTNNDVTVFTKVSGVGKKTALRIILEMKSKLGQDPELDRLLGAGEDYDEGERDDVFAALMALGCSQVEARKAAAGARKRSGKNASDEDLVRSALRSLSKV